MLPLSLLIAGYLFLPVGFALFDRMGPGTLVSGVSSVLLGVSLAAMVLTFRSRRFFFHSLPLVSASLFLLISVLFGRFS